MGNSLGPSVDRHPGTRYLVLSMAEPADTAILLKAIEFASRTRHIVGKARRRRVEYLAWTEEVVAGCRGTNAGLEELYDEVLKNGRATLAKQAK
jgi:hypothetical protein